MCITDIRSLGEDRTESRAQLQARKSYPICSLNPDISLSLSPANEIMEKEEYPASPPFNQEEFVEGLLKVEKQTREIAKPLQDSNVQLDAGTVTTTLDTDCDFGPKVDRICEKIKANINTIQAEAWKNCNLMKDCPQIRDQNNPRRNFVDSGIVSGDYSVHCDLMDEEGQLTNPVQETSEHDNASSSQFCEPTEHEEGKEMSHL